MVIRQHYQTAPIVAARMSTSGGRIDRRLGHSANTALPTVVLIIVHDAACCSGSTAGRYCRGTRHGEMSDSLNFDQSRNTAMAINSTARNITPPVVADVKLVHILSRSAVKASIVSGPV